VMAIEDINHMLSRFHPSSPSNNLAGSTCRLRWKVITVVRVPIVRSAWWPFKETESETNQPTGKTYGSINQRILIEQVLRNSQD